LKSIEVALCATKNWARAKHRTGLERPHSRRRFPGQGPVGSFQPSVLPVDVSADHHKISETECYRVKTVNNAFCAFGPPQVLTTFGLYCRACVPFAKHEVAALLARTVSVPVKWSSPPNFTRATSPTTSSWVERNIRKIIQINDPEGRNCTRPRPCLRRERPHPATHGASLDPGGRSRLVTE
jgi:hypothetical protein